MRAASPRPQATRRRTEPLRQLRRQERLAALCVLSRLREVRPAPEPRRGVVALALDAQGSGLEPRAERGATAPAGVDSHSARLWRIDRVVVQATTTLAHSVLPQQRLSRAVRAIVLRKDRVHSELADGGVVVRVASVVDYDVELIADCDVHCDGCVVVVAVCQCLGLERGVAMVD